MNSTGVKRTLDKLAYISLVLDACIAIITGLTVLDEGFTKHLLVPVDYVLSVVVVLSVALFAALLVLKSKEKRDLRREERERQAP